MPRLRRIAAVAFGALLTIGPSAAQARAETTLVFAAASLTGVLEQTIEAFEAETGLRVVASFAASSALAQQIVSGAPARIFLSANVRWMDHVEQAGLIRPETRTDLLGNRLVLIAPAGGDGAGALGDLSGLPERMGDGRLAVGDPAHVPSGLYARDALEHLGLWRAVEDRLAPMADARRALFLVERGEAPFGIVYATDAAASNRVATVASLPEDAHTPIVYPAARLAGPDDPVAAAFFDFLQSRTAACLFDRAGFSVLGSDVVALACGE